MSGLSSWGGRTIQKLLKEFGSPEEIFAAKKLPVTPAQQEEADEAKRKAGTFPEELHTWEQQGVRFLTQDEDVYKRQVNGSGFSVNTCCHAPSFNTSSEKSET